MTHLLPRISWLKINHIFLGDKRWRQQKKSKNTFQKMVGGILREKYFENLFLVEMEYSQNKSQKGFRFR